MKKILLALFVLSFLATTSCQEKIDTAKEEAAIKAVFEEEKDAFFSQDAARMAETWIQEPSSVKIYMTDKGQTKSDGWSAISKHDQENIKDNSWDRKLVKLVFSDFQINVRNTNAWVMCAAKWDGIFRSDTLSSSQTRINILKKVSGKWKFELMAIYQIPGK